MMNEREIRNLVQDCGLDWHKGFMPLFDGDTTNRFAVLVEAVAAAERERCAKLADDHECGGEDDFMCQHQNCGMCIAGLIRRA